MLEDYAVVTFSRDHGLGGYGYLMLEPIKETHGYWIMRSFREKKVANQSGFKRRSFMCRKVKQVGLVN